MKWLFENGCPWDARAYHNAATHEFHHVLKWLTDNNCPLRLNNDEF
jgi:hypothetical protein